MSGDIAVQAIEWTSNGGGQGTYFFHTCTTWTEEHGCQCFEAFRWDFHEKVVEPALRQLFEREGMTDDPKGPIEDDLEDPAKQDPSTDLPEPNTGNDDADDTEEPADLGEEIAEGDADG